MDKILSLASEVLTSVEKADLDYASQLRALSIVEDLLWDRMEARVRKTPKSDDRPEGGPK